MTRRELDCIGRMFEAVTSVSEPHSAYLQILDASIALTEAFGGHYVYCVETLKQRRLVDIPNGDPSAMKQIIRDHPRYTFQNPVWPYLSAFKGNVLRHLDVVGTKAWENCEFYSEFVRPNKLRDGLCVLFRDSQGSAIWGLGLMYDRKMKYSKSTLMSLERLAPYLSRGIQNLEEWNQRWKSCGGIENAHNARQPIVAVKNGKLMFAYGGAEKILNLDGCDFRRDTSIQELLRLCPVAAQPGAQVRWTARSGEFYRLNSISSPKDDLQLIHLAPFKTALPSADDDTRMARAKGLTAREAQVFKFMARGLSYSEIARELGLSLHTVRTHIRHIYSTLRVTGYVEAINAVRTAQY
jgi:DNA-binding CsgD family transcriptional regulator